MKRQILQLLTFAGIGAFLATGCCYPKQVAVVKKPAVLAPTGREIVKEPEVLPPAGREIVQEPEVSPPARRVIVQEPAVPTPGPILVKEYTVPAPKPGEVVVVVTSNPPPKPVESAWYFTGIRWVWIP
jgi:hypothetical protein